MIRNVEGVVRAPFCEIRKGEGLDPVQVSDGVVQEALVPALAAGRMDSTGSTVADTALAWKALAVASASVCVHEHRAHPEQN